MSFDDDERSVQSNRPIEFYDIVLSTGTTYRICAGERDLQVGSLLYTATPALRSNIAVPTIDGNEPKTLTLTLPVTHAVVKRWFALGSPPKQISVTAWRKQERSALIEQQWVGLVATISCDGNIAKLIVPSRNADTAKRMLATISSGTSCAHILYDTMCKAARASFLVSTTALLVNGRDVRLDIGALAKVGNDWALGGELVHVASGERMTIALQTDADPAFSSVTTLSMQLPIVELRTGDAIQVYAGCDHTITTCNAKFANQANFFGSPYKPTKNPFLPNGLGTVEQA